MSRNRERRRRGPSQGNPAFAAFENISNKNPHTASCGNASTNRAERRRSEAAWRRSIRAFHREAGGLFDTRIVRRQGVCPPSIALAIANWFIAALASDTPPPICLDCDTIFDGRRAQ